MVTTDFLPNVSGIATLSYEQACGLQALGHNIKVFTTMHGAIVPAMKAGLEVQEVEDKQPPVIRVSGFYRVLNDAVRAWKPDFIWCTNYRGFGLPVMAVARRLRIPYGIYLHGTELITENRNLIRRRIFKTVLKRAALLCTNSINTGDLLNKLYQLQATPVTPGVHPAPIESPESVAESTALRQSWLNAKPSTCANPERVVFVAVCRMSRQKGIHIVLEAMAELEPTFRQRALFIAIGSGEAAEELEQLANRLLVSENIIFAGPANRNEVPALLKAADVYLQPSQPEGNFLESFGISFLEAQAAGLPCIGTNWGGIPEAVQGPATSLLVSTGSVKSVADAMTKAITDQPWRATAQISGPAWALQNTWDNHVKTIEGALPN